MPGAVPPIKLAVNFPVSVISGPHIEIQIFVHLCDDRAFFEFECFELHVSGLFYV
jgi:hypothetical protein